MFPNLLNSADLVDSIIKQVEGSFLVTFNQILSTNWILFIHNKSSDDWLFYWSGKELRGPWTCESKQSLGFKF